MGCVLSAIVRLYHYATRGRITRTFFHVFILDTCNTRLADSPRGDGGQSARHRPDIYLDGCGTHLSFLSSSSLRPEPSGARAPAPSSPPSLDFPPPATEPRFLTREPFSAPPPPFQTSRPAPHGRNPSPPPPDAIGVARSFAPPNTAHQRISHLHG